MAEVAKNAPPPAAAAAADVKMADAGAKKFVKKAVKKDKSKQGKKKRLQKFAVNCQAPVDDEIFDISSFQKFLHDNIKLNGKTGVLGDEVKVELEKAIVRVIAKVHMSKRYVKYLTKKFLKQQKIRDYVRVVATGPYTYTLKYFNINEDEDQNA